MGAIERLTLSEEKQRFIEDLKEKGTVGSEELICSLSQVADADDGLLLWTEGTVVGIWGARWDMEHFGYPVGHLSIWDLGCPDGARSEIERLVATGVAEARELGWRLLFCRLDAEAWPSIHALEGAGFRLMDQLVTFQAPTTHMGLLEPPCSVRPLRLDDSGELSEVETLGTGAFANSRFYNDPGFNRERVDDLFRRWTTSVVHRGSVFVAEIDGRIAGYVACSVSADAVVIELIAVAQWARGQGIGKALIRWVQSAFHPNQSRVVVGTQLANRGAVALYSGCGMKLTRAQLTFHLWIK